MPGGWSSWFCKYQENWMLGSAGQNCCFPGEDAMLGRCSKQAVSKPTGSFGGTNRNSQVLGFVFCLFVSVALHSHPPFLRLLLADNLAKQKRGLQSPNKSFKTHRRAGLELRHNSLIGTHVKTQILF